ncbi:hypothetical protein K449DRAFT_395548 [Hypoxylon sp. EC38]|nr:hypothetical protein K449DRAFT_395548 [Hypoxylon sp. EC38]
MVLFAVQKSQYTAIQNRGGENLDEETINSHTELVWRQKFYILLLSSIVLASLSAIGVSYGRHNLSCPSSSVPGFEEPYNPDSPKFMGQPRPELDEAWHDLLSGTLIRFSEEELLLANNASSIAHKDGGYVGGLGVSHSLHCLARRNGSSNIFIQNTITVMGSKIGLNCLRHVDHCLESIRMELLCKASVDIYTLVWTTHSTEKPSVSVPQPHVCVDWNDLHAWMKSRAASYNDMVKPAEFD